MAPMTYPGQNPPFRASPYVAGSVRDDYSSASFLRYSELNFWYLIQLTHQTYPGQPGTQQATQFPLVNILPPAGPWGNPLEAGGMRGKAMTSNPSRRFVCYQCSSRFERPVDLEVWFFLQKLLYQSIRDSMYPRHTWEAILGKNVSATSGSRSDWFGFLDQLLFVVFEVAGRLSRRTQIWNVMKRRIQQKASLFILIAAQGHRSKGKRHLARSSTNKGPKHRPSILPVTVSLISHRL